MRNSRLHEDWCAVGLAGLLLALSVAGLLAGVPKFSPWTVDPTQAFPGVVQVLALGLGLGVVTLLAVAALGQDVRQYAAGFPLIFGLAVAAQLIGTQATVQSYGLEYVLWALVFGLVLSNAVKLPDTVLAAARTE